MVNQTLQPFTFLFAIHYSLTTIHYLGSYQLAFLTPGKTPL